MKPILLLLPGMLCDHGFWQAQSEALADLCAPRVATYGQADTIGHMAEQVLADAPLRFALAGHSMGGRVALEVMRRAPGRVMRLGLFCTDFRGPEDEISRAEEAAHRQRLMAHAREHGMESLARLWFTSLMAPFHRSNEAMIEAMVAMGARHTPDQFAAEVKAGLRRNDQSSVLSGIACPTLVCAGELDALRPVVGHVQMAERIPQSVLVIIQGSGHMVSIEQPEALTAAMRNWLQPGNTT